MRLWITRTSPAAARVEQAVQSLGVSSVCEPLLLIEPVAAMPITGFLDAAAVLSVHAAPALAELKPDVGRWFAVGRETALATARSIGLADHVVTTPVDQRSEGLIELLRPVALSGGRVALVSGAGGRELLPQRLAQLGAEVVRLEVYRRVPNPSVAQPVCDVVEIASAAALDCLAALGGDTGTAVVVASARLAEHAAAIGFQNVHNAGGADADALVAVLRDMLEAR